MLFEFVDFANARLAAALAGFRLPSGIFWLYFSGSLLLVAGLVKILKDELPQTHGLDKIMPFGRLFLAIPLAVFGTEHFTNTGGYREHRSALDSGAGVLGLLRGSRSDRRSPEHHRPEPVAVGGSAFGRHVFFIRTLDRHTWTPGTSLQSSLLDPHTAVDSLLPLRLCFC